MSARGPLELDTCRDYVIPALKRAHWKDEQIIEQRYFTDGRIVPTGSSHRRKPGKRTDYLLEIEPGLPIAVVEAKRLYRLPGDGLQQGMEYAEILGIPFAYASNGRGIVEHDYDTGAQTDLDGFPTPEELWNRYRGWRGLVDDEVVADLVLPFNRDLRKPDGSIKEPRYYQQIAIDRALAAILTSKKRALLTMATGTGKTFVALQIVWKLWSSKRQTGRKPRILYLADRNILVDQPIDREFSPVFGQAIWKVSGSAKTGREIYFALYQNLADAAEGPGVFHDYPRDFFDLVIVDECHRGSARDDSTWRAILKHFESAAQLGMTATPLREDNRDTYRYFGNPIYQYSLAQGIDDGFLAPYRVRRVVLSPDAIGWAPEKGQLDRYQREIPEGLYTTPHFERVVSLLQRTEAAARHLTEHLKKTDRFAKTIVFCVDTEHAEQMRKALHEANSDLTRQYPHYVARIIGTEGDVGRRHLDDFIDPEKETPVIATTSKLLGTGVDIPSCRNIVLFKPFGSMVEFKQAIGRGTRVDPDHDKLSFQIIDYSGATALFADPHFDGDPEAITDEEIDAEGNLVDETEVAEPDVEYGADEAEAGDVSVEELEGEGARKFYVDDGEVYIHAESIYVLDPNTEKLVAVSYERYVTDQVRRLFPDALELRTRWRSHEGREDIIQMLEARGITFEELAEKTELVEADPFDVLMHVAWNAPVLSRRERAGRLRKEHAAFLEEFAPHARQILDELLEKYADHGIDQLDDLHVLEVPPFSTYGSPVEIAGRFGGSESLKRAMERLQDLLYAA